MCQVEILVVSQGSGNGQSGVERLYGTVSQCDNTRATLLEPILMGIDFYGLTTMWPGRIQTFLSSVHVCAGWLSLSLLLEHWQDSRVPLKFLVTAV